MNDCESHTGQTYRTINRREINREKFYIAYTLNMMMYLVRHGFDVVKAEDSINNPHYKVFLFRNTPELVEAINEYNKK